MLTAESEVGNVPDAGQLSGKFPLTQRGDGRWCKKYRGQMYYFRGSRDEVLAQWHEKLAKLTTGAAGLVTARRLSDIKPSPENLDIYQPVTADSVRDLAADIKQNGILDPLVVTIDGYILSGHRRHTAARLAGLDTVPVRIHSIRRSDDVDAFVRLLISFNDQRVKTFAEKLHEEAAKIDPAQAYRRLVSERAERSQVKVTAMDLGERKTRARISAAKRPMLDTVLAILNRVTKPVSDRRLHYEMVETRPVPLRNADTGLRYKNDRNSYSDLCNLLTRARIGGIIPWDWISDETRPLTTWNVWPDTQLFLRAEMRKFLTGYYRDLLRSQANHIEVLAEKNTVATQLHDVCSTYCMAMTSGRGFCSSRPRHDLQQRYIKSGKDKLILLIVSDLDPAGMDIAESFARSMRDDFGIERVHAIKVAITIEQVQQYGIPHGDKAKKGRGKNDRQRARFVERFGEFVYEVEALPDGELPKLLDEAIRSVLDLDAFNHEVEQEERDAIRIEATRRIARQCLRDLDIDLDSMEGRS
jgi:hypothetical protein